MPDALARLLDAERFARRVPDATVLRAWQERARGQLATAAAATAAPPASLTAAELRILRYLPTHLSFREIAERTFVSANTVKTQANAVYRKLDVSSRSEAVTCAPALGVLDPILSLELRAPARQQPVHGGGADDRLARAAASPAERG